MRILIGYDGSAGAETSIKGLTRAGLPHQAEVCVLTVADVWLPQGEAETGPVSEAVWIVVQRAQEKAQHHVEEARARAERARERVQALFPEWAVTAEAVGASPAAALVEKAGTWDADLLVIGAHGFSSFHRYVLGSVCLRVVSEAPCSVRVARANPVPDDRPPRLVVGVDGSPGAKAAVEAVCDREWPTGTECRVIAAYSRRMATAPAALEMLQQEWLESGDHEDDAWLHRLAEASAVRLREAGLSASSLVVQGSPQHVLVEEAEQWDADTLFVGARGLSGETQSHPGGIATAVTIRAHCSVEVIRRKS